MTPVVPWSEDHQSSADISVAPRGDAHVLLTAPFHLDSDPLRGAHQLQLPPDHTMAGRFRLCSTGFGSLFQGTLTYQDPELGNTLLHVEGTAELLTAASEAIKGESRCESIRVLAFPDGTGAVSLRFIEPGGWNHRDALGPFGLEDREDTARRLRELILAELTDLLHSVEPRFGEAPPILPYINMTYGGLPTTQNPGRAHLDDAYRDLVYPSTPEPLTSSSPWASQFAYIGYAYMIVLDASPERSLQKLSLLLKILDITYLRLARASAAARSHLDHPDVLDLKELEDIAAMLDSNYRDLTNPTFSFDHHALCLRDAIFTAWDIDTLNASAQAMLLRVQRRVQAVAAQNQQRRNRWIQLGLAAISALSLISAVESAINLVGIFR